MAMNMPPGMDMPPLPPGVDTGISKMQLIEMLSDEIKIDNTESEDIKALKQRVIDARKAMIERLNNGENFDTVLAEHRTLVNENAAIYRECEQQLRKIIAEGDEELAIEYRTTVSEALDSMGIDSLNVPITKSEKESLRNLRRIRHRARIENRKLKKIKKEK
jgi:hypothetical protein